MKATIIEVLGEITEEQQRKLTDTVLLHDVRMLLPGDGFIIEQKEGVPPKIAYLNRRIFLPGAGAERKLIFEVGIPQQAPVQIDSQKLYEALKEFVIRKSAAFTRPEMAAKELTDFFIKYTGD